jgi:hypothetical protein
MMDLACILGVAAIITPIIIFTKFRDLYTEPAPPSRRVTLATGAMLGPIVGVIVTRMIVEATQHPKGEGAIGWDAVSLAIGAPGGWIAGLVLPTIAFAVVELLAD